MNHSLSIILLYAVALIPSPALAQDGFRLIAKAEKKFEEGKYRQAIKLIIRADEADYGFCGNAWMDASHDINLLRAKINIQKGNYETARQNLDDIALPKYENLDSIRIITFQLELGKDTLSAMIDSSLTQAYIQPYGHDLYMNIPLVNGIHTLSFKITNFLCVGYYNSGQKNESRDAWLRYFRASGCYSLLRNE